MPSIAIPLHLRVLGVCLRIGRLLIHMVAYAGSVDFSLAFTMLVVIFVCFFFFFFSSRRRHTRFDCDWSSDVCSSDLYADEFIERLPQGFDTRVGERGMCLSGGERQRISLARAFLKDAPLLILDEPTSAVDVGTEAAIVDAMARLMRGRTTLLISHRQKVFVNCDLILTVGKSRPIVE